MNWTCKFSKAKSAIAKRHLLLLLCAVVTLAAQGKDVRVSSPNGRLVTTISDAGGSLSYSVALDKKVLFSQSALQMQLEDKTLGEGAKILSAKLRDERGVLRPVVPMKQAEIKNDYTEALVRMKGNYEIAFRVFDNAVAYRYILHESDSVYVVEETFNLKPKEPMQVHYQPTSTWGTSSENIYVNGMLADWSYEGDMAVLPLCLSSTTSDLQLLISESDLRDYPSMYLRGKGEEDCLAGVLVPYYKDWELSGDRGTQVNELAAWAAHTSGERSFPWRYIVIGDSKTLLEQTLTAQLAGESELTDTSWIKPGQVSWDWWNHKSIYGPDVNFTPGCNTDTYKYYIDFASRYGIKYIIMDEGWSENTFSPFKANDNLDLHECIRYGKEKGVGIILWLTWTCVERYKDTLFSTYEQWGVAGTKIDFMDRQDQWMINWYESTTRAAAEHHILVDFHGAMKPAGLEQRYPNLLSYEGVRGLEMMSTCLPENTLYIPFLRNAVGAADFTPGAMINTQPEYDRWSDPNPSAVGTRAYSMALFTIMESGVQMLADAPTQYYKNADCTEYITQIPVTWDETRAIEAKVGEYLIVAKRKGERWFVAGICNNDERERFFDIPLTFLSTGPHEMQIVTDGFNAERQAMDYRIEKRSVDSSTLLNVRMVRNGGFTAIIE